MIKVLLIISLLILGSAGFAQTNPADSVKPELRIEISSKTVSDGSVYDTLDIIIRNPDIEIGGFDLKIGWLSSYIDVLDIVKGELYTECKWELFNSRQSFLQTYRGGSEPVRIIQLVGLADMAGDTTKPLCFSNENDLVIASIVVTSTLLETMPDTSLPFFFIWEDCSDNTLAGKMGNKLFMSKSVTERLSPVMLDSGDRFPSTKGTPKHCLKGDRPNQPYREIDFVNGGIKTELVVELDTLK